jgi:D-3-phosphoglycerate dehydrogenase
MTEQNFKVSYIGYRPNTNLDDTIEELEKVGAKMDLLPFLDDEDEIIQQTKGADALIVVEAPITRKVLTALGNDQCKAVLRTGVGFDCIDVEAATDNGIAVINVPDMWTREVANHAMTLLLTCNRMLVNQLSDVRNETWRPTPSAHFGPLHTETVGIVGMGRIGSAFAQRIGAFETEVIAYDPYIDAAAFEAVGATSVSFDDVLSRSDYISVHTPLNDETHHLINADALSKMKSTAYLINTSRGPVVDETALINALQQGQILGAGLDVLESEPPEPSNPLLSMDNVVITPHSAHYSQLSMAIRPRRYGVEIATVLDGRKPMNLVNPPVLEVLHLQ